jgi:hypothetical protein
LGISDENGRLLARLEIRLSYREKLMSLQCEAMSGDMAAAQS